MIRIAGSASGLSTSRTGVKGAMLGIPLKLQCIHFSPHVLHLVLWKSDTIALPSFSYPDSGAAADLPIVSCVRLHGQGTWKPWEHRQANNAFLHCNPLLCRTQNRNHPVFETAFQRRTLRHLNA
ncbi:MAG: hypothetical protein ACYDA1_10515 [Vulcanimicrobiaceae bacterium]